MLQYILAGLALGSIYAIASASLVVTYVSSGVVNFAFGSMAYFVARFYYWLHSEQGWGILPSALVSLLVLAPLMGALLYVTVFRHLRQRSALVRIVVTIGVSVALPPLAAILFGNNPIPEAPGLAPRPIKVFHFFGAAVNLDQVIIYGFVIFVLVLGTLLLRFTDIGLKVRALVDSEALTAQSGTSPSKVSLGVWAVSTTLAGLVGILVAPTQGLTIAGMTLLMASAFAAFVAARLKSLASAVIISLVMGVVTDVIQKYLPANSEWTNNIVPAIPFVFILVFLLFYLVRTGSVSETAAGAGALDRAITPPAAQNVPSPATLAVVRSPYWKYAGLIPFIVIGLFPVIFDGFWLNLVAQGMALAVALLSYTVVTGEGGMIWLCQITFAGGGAVAAAELATNHGVSPLLAVILGALIIVPIGVLVGALTIRFGDLHVALVTLSFGLLIDVLVFPRSRFYQGGLGVDIDRPSFAVEDRPFAYLCFAIFVILALLVLNFRRSTTGLAMSAVRWSEPAARTMGLSVVKMKMLVAAFSTFIAALGGGLIAMWNGSSQTTSFSAFQGLIWLAVLVTIGVRSISAAAIAALVFTMLGNVFTTYIPNSPGWIQVPALLFGLGAIGIAMNPDGVVAQNARAIPVLISKLRRSTPAPVATVEKG